MASMLDMLSFRDQVQRPLGLAVGTRQEDGATLAVAAGALRSVAKHAHVLAGGEPQGLRETLYCPSKMQKPDARLVRALQAGLARSEAHERW